jgi:hypothetical protein
MVDESETVAGAQAGETPQPTSPQLGTSPPPLTGLAEQAVKEYEQIARELAVRSPTVVETPSLQDECHPNSPGLWCLPKVSCSARGFTKETAQAFEENRTICGLT